MDSVDPCSKSSGRDGQKGSSRVKTPTGPQRLLQTATNQGVRYVKGVVHGLPNDRRLPTPAMFKIPRSYRLGVSGVDWGSIGQV
eukprot:9359856-Pyramimonas_sp.AAC.1